MKIDPKYYKARRDAAINRVQKMIDLKAPDVIIGKMAAGLAALCLTGDHDYIALAKLLVADEIEMKQLGRQLLDPESDFAKECAEIDKMIDDHDIEEMLLNIEG